VHSKNCRLYFTAGDRAINLATTSINSIRSIAKLLSSGSDPEEVIANVAKINDSATELRRREKKLLAEIAKDEAVRVKDILRTGKHAWVHRATEGLDFINSIVFDVKDALKDGGLVVLALGEEKKGGLIVLVGDKNSVEGFVTKIQVVVTGIKGGGKGERWQGKVIGWKKGQLEALKNLVEEEA
jgi:misacylated tRNA(Ala) deacylase